MLSGSRPNYPGRLRIHGLIVANAKICRIGVGITFLLVAAPALAAAVTLSASTSPSSGQPATTNINVTGSGFPSGIIPAWNVTVTLQPSGAGASVTTTATSIRTIAGTVREISFQIPTAVTVTVATPYQVSIAGTTSTGVPFSSANTSALTVIPAASIVSVSPNTGQPGQTLSVTITAVGTNFIPGSTQANFGAGISVGGVPAGTFGPVTVTSPTTAVAAIVIAPAAAAGARTVVVDPGGQQAALTGGFTIPGVPLITGLTNVVTLSQFQAFDLGALGNCGENPDCFSIQQNFYIITPPSSDLFTYWAQNAVVVFGGPCSGWSPGLVCAYQLVNIWDMMTFGTKTAAVSISSQAVAVSLPITLTFTSTISQGVLTLATYSNGSTLSSLSFSSVSCVAPPACNTLPFGTLNSGSYIENAAAGQAGTPPELVLVGAGAGSQTTFSSTTSGSVTSQIILRARRKITFTI
jgi:hypothetical protein